MATQLEQLRDMTTVVADTGDMDAIAKYKPVDSTTNPSLLLNAADSDAYAPLIDDAIKWAKEQSGNRPQQIVDACDKLVVNAGCKILELIPGRVSTEVDARLSFDSQATIGKAERLIAMYEDAGIQRDRVLIKVASTWEGIRAAENITRKGIDCNMTLLFGFEQAVAAAEAGVFLVSPFVGRIMDWYVAHTDNRSYDPHTDPGVKSVRRIYDWYKSHGFETVIMGASFRNIGQIQALAGCDRLTISPDLMEELDNNHNELKRELTDPGKTEQLPEKIDEKAFRWGMNEDAMATDKLAEGIRRFAADQVKLEKMLEQRF